MDLKELEWGGAMDWTDRAQKREGWCQLVNALMNLRVP